MKGTNPIRPPAPDDVDMLAVQEIFATLQGEGPYAGWPALFIRLGGCNLACHFCDTEFESFTSMTVTEILERLRALRPDVRGAFVVITGGEPLRQPIARLCQALLDEAIKVQVETNGTLYRLLPEGVELICSPKNTQGSYHPIRADLLPWIRAYKFLISASYPGYQEVPDWNFADCPVYLQPMDEDDPAKNAANAARAVAMVQNGPFRLSLQLHKMLGIP